MSRKRILILVTMVIVSIFGVACTNNTTPNVTEEPKNQGESQQESKQENQVVEDVNDKIDMQEAKKMAFDEINDTNGVIVEYELDNEYNHTYHEFDIQLNNEKREVKVDAKTGEIIKDQLTQNNHTIGEYDKYIGFDEAWKIILDKTDKENSLITKFELDDHDDTRERAYYEFEIKEGNKEYEIKIDAKTGEVLERD